MTPQEVVERAYAVFAARGLPPVMDFCGHCWTADEERRLHGPVRTIPDGAMSSYVKDAVHIVGTGDDFAHFAPRVLEDVFADRAVDPAWWLVKFRDARWQDWRDEERAVVRDALDVLWQRRLASWQPGDDAEEVLSGIGAVLWDLGPLLAAWAARTDRPAVANLADLMVRNPDSVRSGEPLGDAWWEDVPMAQVVVWLREPERAAQLAAAVDGSGDPIDAVLAEALALTQA